MRLLKGSKVEVLTRNDVPIGAWRSAEIITGNGHTYSVRYDCFPITGESASVERVPRKAIRPCPPTTNGTDDWVHGDIVEAFHESCWKPAQIIRVSGENIFFVRVIGSNSEFEAHRSCLRARQAWEDGNWFLVGKCSSNSSSPKRKRLSLGFSDAGAQKKRIIVRIPSLVCKKRIIVAMPTLIVKGDVEKKKVQVAVVEDRKWIYAGQSYMPIDKLLRHCIILDLWHGKKKQRISHCHCWRHPYIASKAMIGFKFVTSCS